MTDATRLQAFRLRCEESEHRIQRQAGTKTKGIDTVEQALAKLDKTLAEHKSYRNTRPEQFWPTIDERIERLRNARWWLSEETGS